MPISFSPMKSIRPAKDDEPFVIVNPPVRQHEEVRGRTERPIQVQDYWVSLPSWRQRLAAYRVVALCDRMLIVVHADHPQVRLALKVLRKTCWPVALDSPVDFPKPIPHMIRLVDWIETEDAVFLIMELATGGRLWDHVWGSKVNPSKQSTCCSPSPCPSPCVPTSLPMDGTVDVETMVMNAQRLLASVNRTLERSAAQHKQLKTAETSLDTSKLRKPRSKSVLPRNLQRRFSSDSATGRTHSAHSSLDRSMSRPPVQPANEEDVREWATCLVIGLDSLHSAGLVWRDLYPGNILLGHRGLLLSFHHRWPGVESPLNPAAVSGFYIAPEVLSVFPVSSACDWWSLGVILYQLLTGVPFCEAHPHGLSKSSILELPDNLSAQARSLLSGLLMVDPHQRLGGGAYGSEEIKSHSFFNMVDWDSDALYT